MEALRVGSRLPRLDRRFRIEAGTTLYTEIRVVAVAGRTRGGIGVRAAGETTVGIFFLNFFFEGKDFFS
jgi:hypothetical protein